MTERKPMDQKTPEIKAAIEGIFPGTAQAIAEKKCQLCRNPIGEFKDELSKKEYLISGMCQGCQNQVFGAD
jgi:hypothetical protein